MFGPDGRRVFEKPSEVTIEEGEQPFALPVFKERIRIDGPTGRYRLVVAFEKGAARRRRRDGILRFQSRQYAGGRTRDCPLGRGRRIRGMVETQRHSHCEIRIRQPRSKRSRPFSPPEHLPRREAMRPLPIWSSASKPARTSSSSVRTSSARETTRPATCPLKQRGHIGTPQEWLYHVDQWAKRHPIFDGLQSGGLMDYAYYLRNPAGLVLHRHRDPLRSGRRRQQRLAEIRIRPDDGDLPAWEGTISDQHVVGARESREGSPGRAAVAEYAKWECYFEQRIACRRAQCRRSSRAPG